MPTPDEMTDEEWDLAHPKYAALEATARAIRNDNIILWDAWDESADPDVRVNGCKDDARNGTVWYGVTMLHVRYAAAEGDVDGGLYGLMRFMMEARGQSVPPGRPAGWYWTGTIEKRGVWTRYAGPFGTYQEASEAAEAAWRNRTWED